MNACQRDDGLNGLNGINGMNKAFTKEPEEDQELDPIEDAPRPRGTQHITKEGYRALHDELKRMWEVERPKITDEVSAAAAQGDRSENAEYIYGKKKLREIDRRIRFLTKRLDSAEVVKQEGSHAEVRFGATVDVEDENGKKSRYLILGPDEASPSSGSISFQSPLGRALMKRKVGDTVSVVRPAGEIEIEIKAIRYE